MYAVALRKQTKKQTHTYTGRKKKVSSKEYAENNEMVTKKNNKQTNSSLVR